MLCDHLFLILKCQLDAARKGAKRKGQKKCGRGNSKEQKIDAVKTRNI